MDFAGRNHGQNGDRASFAPGLSGEAFSFSGLEAAGYRGVILGNSPDFDFAPASSFTIEAWVNSLGPPIPPHDSQTILVFNRFCGPAPIQVLAISDSGRLLFQVTDTAGATAGPLLSPEPLSYGSWHHVAASREVLGGEKTLKVYVDGVLVASAADPSTGNLAPRSAIDMVGGILSCSAGQIFHGLIDEPAIYGRALSSQEISDLYNAGSAGKCKPSVETEIVDPNPDLLLESGDLVAEGEALASGQGDLRTGAAADGVTRVLLRSTLSGPGSVTVSLDGAQSPEDGFLSLPGSSVEGASVTVPVAQTAKGFRAFTVYRTPAEFNRPTRDEGAKERTLRFHVVFTPEGAGKPVEKRIDFKLVRPPVVLVHGLWSDETTWDKFPLANDDPRFSVIRANYPPADSFSENREAVRWTIQKAVRKLRGLGIAATQVDLVGHSMGGVLSRIWVANPYDFKRIDNFRQGDVHKLITVDSPHTGSDYAGLAAASRDLFSGLLKLLGSAYLDSKLGGALDDLSKGSNALCKIPEAQVPSHALVGTGCPSSNQPPNSKFENFDTVRGFLSGQPPVPRAEQSDCIVMRSSQEGGIAPTALSIFPGPEGVHGENTRSGLYSNRVVELLNADSSSPLFARFPAVRTLGDSECASPPKSLLRSSAPRFASIEDGLRITAPAAGSIVAPGTVVQVTVEPLPGRLVSRVLLAGTGVAMTDEASPFTFDLPIPADAAGDFFLTAVGRHDGDRILTSPEVRLEVRPSAALEGIEAVPDSLILLGPGDRSRLSILGHFADGIGRRLGNGFALEFETGSPGIATVSPDGEVTAQGLGTTTVTVRMGAFAESVAVTVFDGHPVPVLSSLIPVSASAGSPGLSLTVHGSGFADRAVVLWNDSPRPTRFVSPAELIADISAADLSVPGEAEVRVFSPGPGGGTSGAAVLPILSSSSVAEVPTLSEWGLLVLAAALAIGSLLRLRLHAGR